MKVEEILAGIDQEIARLQQARTLLAGEAPRRRGRPPGSKSATATKSAKSGSTGKKTRRLSPEGRKRIAEAMRKRWAERKKTSAA